MGDGTDYQIEEAYDYTEEELRGFGYEVPTTHVVNLMGRYEQNKSAKIGDAINCPVCDKRFVKRTRDHTFCSNGRRKKGGNCKDRYWNSVDDERRERAKTYKKV